MTSAESAYLFRHAILREAAYQLHLPAERARLHELALEAIPALFAGRGEAALDQHAADLADHAMAAALARRDITGNLARLRELATQEAHWLQRAANCAEAAWQLEAALAFWNRLADLPETQPRTQVRAMQRALGVRRKLGQSREVVVHAPAVLQAARQAADSDTLARALQILATAELDTESAARAEVTARQALQAAQQAEDAALAARIAGNLAVCLATQRRFEEARSQYHEVLEMARRTANWSEYAMSLGNLANIGSQTGQYAQSERQYRVALALARRHCTVRDLSILNDKLGVICAYQGRYDDARVFMDKAIEMARRCGDRLLFGKALGNLATLLDECGLSAQGREMLCQALDVSRECGNHFSIAAFALNLSRHMPADGQEFANLLAESEAAAQRVSAQNLLGIIHCTRALATLDTAGATAAKRAWREGHALLLAVRAQWEADRAVAEMQSACAARGIAPFDAG